jgi:hypothetical protein
MKLQIRKAVVIPLLIEYAVHLDNPVLYVRKVMFLPPALGQK